MCELILKLEDLFSYWKLREEKWMKLGKNWNEKRGSVKDMFAWNSSIDLYTIILFFWMNIFL